MITLKLSLLGTDIGYSQDIFHQPKSLPPYNPNKPGIGDIFNQNIPEPPDDEDTAGLLNPVELVPDVPEYLELTLVGTIACSILAKSLAVFSGPSGTSLYSIGQTPFAGYSISEILPRKVYLTKGASRLLLIPGDTLETSNSIRAPSSNQNATEVPLERSGNTTLVTRTYVDHIIKNKLSEVIMEVTAIPVFQDGVLTGIMLDNLDESSQIFNSLGFKNKDTITAMDGVKLTGVSQAINLLKNLRQSSRIEITLIREGVEQTSVINVQ